MNPTKAILSTVVALFAMNTFAQGTAANEDELFARQRAEAYSAALGLDEKATNKLVSVYMEAEPAVAPLREECNAIKAKVEETLTPFDERAEESLTKEQRAKLAEMRAAGTWRAGDMCCALEAGKAAGCAGHAATGTGAGCCAGKAGAGKANDKHTKVAPVPTSAPDSK